MEFVILYALAWAVVGAVEQMAADARGYVAARTRPVRERTSAAVAGRTSAVRSAPWKARPLAKGGLGLLGLLGRTLRWAWHGADNLVRYGPPAVRRSAGAGWRAGWARGRARYYDRKLTEPCPDCDAPPGTRCGDDCLAEQAARSAPAPATSTELAAPAAGTEPDGQPAAGSSPEGDTVTNPNPTITAEAYNIEGTRTALEQAATVAEHAMSALDGLLGGLSAHDIDPATHGEVADIFTAAEQMKTAAEKALAGLNSRHAQVEEAINSTDHAAQRDFYKK